MRKAAVAPPDAGISVELSPQPMVPTRASVDANRASIEPGGSTRGACLNVGGRGCTAPANDKDARNKRQGSVSVRMKGPRVSESGRPSKQGKRLVPIVIVVALVVILAVFLAWSVIRPKPPATNPLDFTLPEATSTPAGRPWRLADHLGSMPILLEFMQPEPIYCQLMVPVLRDLQNGTYGPRIQIVSVAVYVSNPLPTLAGVADFAHSVNTSWSYLVETNGTHVVRDLYNITGIPTVVVLARDGSVAWTHRGLTDLATLESGVRLVI